MAHKLLKILNLHAIVAALVLCVSLPALAQQTPTSPTSGRGPRAIQADRTTRQAQDRDNQRDSRSRTASRGVGGVLTLGGGDGAAGARVIGPQEAFEPILDKPVSYGAVPDTDQRVTLSLAGPMIATEFLDTLAVATDWNIMATPSLKEVELQFWVKDISPNQAMAILEFNDLYYEYDADANILLVMKRDEYLQHEHGEIVEREFVLKYVSIVNAEVVAASLLSARGRLISDPRSSKLLIYDTSENLKYIAAAIEDLDVPRETRAFPLVHVDASFIYESVAAVMTENGRLTVDPRTNTLLVLDRPDRLEQISGVINALDRELETRSWTLDYADPEIVADQLFALVPQDMGAIVVNPDIHQITVTATANRIEAIARQIAVWDVKRRQVQIEAYLATMSSNIVRELGIDWSFSGSYNGNPVGVDVGAIPSLGGVVGGQQVSYISDKLSSVLTSLDTKGDATILAHPRITVQDGQEAVFENTTQVPFAQSTTTIGGVNTSVDSKTQIAFIDVGTILKVLPRISNEDDILLDIVAEDSSFVSVTFTANGEENTVPQKTQNKASTQVLVNDGQTIVLGGLRTTNYADNLSKVPVLGDLPLLGRLFRSTDKDHQDQELLIFLTPTIVNENTQPESDRLAVIENELAITGRMDRKTNVERMLDRASRDNNEVAVTVGQSGGLLVNGRLSDLDELRGVLDKVPRGLGKRVIIRAHPRAPQSSTTEVLEAVMESGLKMEIDAERFPFVPAAGGGR